MKIPVINGSHKPAGDTSKEDWKYAFSGVNTKNGNMIYDGTTYLYTDENLAEYGWYSGNSSGGTHAAGTKNGNRLNVYDMIGNVCEWNSDFYGSDATSNDSEYTKNGYVTDPKGVASGTSRILRGASWYNNASCCSVATTRISAIAA